MNNKVYLIETRTEDYETALTILVTCLAAREKLCKPLKAIELRKKTGYIYIAIEGEDIFLKRIIKRYFYKMKRLAIPLKLYEQNTTALSSLTELILLNTDKNAAGSIYVDYTKDNEFKKRLTKATNNFLLKEDLLPKHNFCPNCEGYGTLMELSNTEGYYKCKYCGTDIVTPGPLSKKYDLLNQIESLETNPVIGQFNTLNNAMIVAKKELASVDAKKDVETFEKLKAVKNEKKKGLSKLKSKHKELIYKYVQLVKKYKELCQKLNYLTEAEQEYIFSKHNEERSFKPKTTVFGEQIIWNEAYKKLISNNGNKKLRRRRMSARLRKKRTVLEGIEQLKLCI